MITKTILIDGLLESYRMWSNEISSFYENYKIPTNFYELYFILDFHSFFGGDKKNGAISLPKNNLPEQGTQFLRASKSGALFFKNTKLQAQFYGNEGPLFKKQKKEDKKFNFLIFGT